MAMSQEEAEPKKAARKDRKEPKDSKAKPKKTEAKSSRTHQQSKKKEPKDVKVLQVREFVRDIVVDYIEGQPDPPESPVDGKPQKQKQREKDSKEPIAQSNRNGFIWVVDAGESGYTHDSKSARPTPSAKKSRCDVCAKPCAHERLYRVRCYARRPPGQISELRDPRVMRQETYHAGAKFPMVWGKGARMQQVIP
eukprot:Skav235499  [mRNA]  locus=scaffold153:234307:234891:+ [translate_table: standard]